MLDRINDPSYYKCLPWKVSIANREAWAMQELFIKEKEKILEKMDKCLRYWKQWVLRCPPKKRRKMNKIAHDFLQKCFQISIKRDMFQGA